MDGLRASWNRKSRRASRAIGLLGGVLLSGYAAAVAAMDVNYSGLERAITATQAASDASGDHQESIRLTNYTDEEAANGSAQGCENPCGCDGCQTGDCYACQCCQGGYGLGNCWSCPIRSTNHCYDNFISPMTNPVFFEDPRTLSEARFIFLNHKVPLAAGGGDIQLYALQIRAALSDRLSLIASKDGYIVSSNPLVDDGWADVSIGLKYMLYGDPCSQTLLSGGVVYDAPFGTPDALQGNGDGTFDLFLSGGTQLCCCGHWVSGLGLVLPADDTDESTWSYWSNHFDYYIGRGVYALTEFNWYHYLESGAGGIPGVEGGDLFNFGSTGVAGNDIVSGAFGLKYKPNRNTEIGVAWEVPLTERRDVLENRLTFDLIRRF